jgi:hypothetical protein
MGAHLLGLRRAAAATPAPAYATGLLQGAPEHDFGGDTKHYYYNNNV